MISAFKNIFTPQTPAATLVDGKIILSFPRAITPVVWQMDIATVKISALEIQRTDDGATLVLKSPAADTITIATFDDHDHAVEQLVYVSRALSKSQGTTQHNSTQQGNSSIWKKLFKGIGILFALFVILIVVLNIGAAINSQTPSTNATIEDRPNDGSPISADDFLKGQ